MFQFNGEIIPDDENPDVRIRRSVVVPMDGFWTGKTLAFFPCRCLHRFFSCLGFYVLKNEIVGENENIFGTKDGDGGLFKLAKGHGRSPENPSEYPERIILKDSVVCHSLFHYNGETDLYRNILSMFCYPLFALKHFQRD